MIVVVSKTMPDNCVGNQSKHPEPKIHLGPDSGEQDQY